MLFNIDKEIRNRVFEQFEGYFQSPEAIDSFLANTLSVEGVEVEAQKKPLNELFTEEIFTEFEKLEDNDKAGNLQQLLVSLLASFGSEYLFQNFNKGESNEEISQVDSL